MDLAAEREAAVQRNESRDAEKWLAYRSRKLRTEGADVSTEAARDLWPGRTDAELAEIVDRARADIKERAMGRKDITRWAKDEVLARGAALFGVHPEATSALIYEMLEREANGRALCSEKTWIFVWAPAARKLAGILSPRNSKARKNGGGHGSGRADAVRPAAGNSPAGTTSRGRTISEGESEPEVGAGQRDERANLQSGPPASGSPDSVELREAAAALLACYEEVSLDGGTAGGSWLAWIGENADEVMVCIRLRKALGMELPDELVELREALR